MAFYKVTCAVEAPSLGQLMDTLGGFVAAGLMSASFVVELDGEAHAVAAPPRRANGHTAAFYAKQAAAGKVVEPPALATLPAPKKKKRRGMRNNFMGASGGALKVVVDHIANHGPQKHGELGDVIEANGFAKTGVGGLLARGVKQNLLRRDSEGRYSLGKDVRVPAAAGGPTHA